MKFDINACEWVRKPKEVTVLNEKITVTTEPNTDLWQRTYYGFRNDSAPLLLMQTSEKYFSFTVKTEFESKRRFDQCGVAVYLDCDNWLKASVEYENGDFQRLGSVVTNDGYSDWATTDIPANIKTVWYRLSRRGSDYCIESSFDGMNYKQMRICHLVRGAEKIAFGIYACSPENSSFKATFGEMQVTECMWKEHK